MDQKKIGKLNTHIIAPNEDTHAKHVVIILHGYGADGQDLISVAQFWAQKIPDTLFLLPDAPIKCEHSAFGRQWFSLDDYSPKALKHEIEIAYNDINSYIDSVIKEFGITADKILLSGFSQGAMMALHAGLKRTKRCAGILGYSGKLVNHDIAKNSPHDNLPIHLIHGSSDIVVPVQNWEDAMETLQQSNDRVTGYKTKGLGHGIDINGIESGMFFIKDCLE